MKKINLLFLLLVMLATSSVMAQTDMTDRISDPDFEQEGRSPWHSSSFGRQGNSTFPLKHGGYYYEVWSGERAGDAYIYQDLTNLPIGTYTLTVACQNIKESNTSQVCTGTWIYANDNKTNFNQPADYSVSCVVMDGKLRIGAEVKNCTGNYVCIDNMRLTRQVIYADVKDYLEQLVAEVGQINQHDGSAEEMEMELACNALKELMDASQSEGLDAALTRLQEAMRAYRLHIASPMNPMDMTDLITNPSFENEKDGWQFDGMQTQSNDDFRKVGTFYAEKWCEGGRGVDNANLFQTLSNLPNGNYRLTAVAQNIQQSSPNTKQRGCYIFANNSSTEINVYGTYSVSFVSISGNTTIGFQTLSATGNYCCVDDFHLYYLGYDEEAIQVAFNELISVAQGLLDKDMNTDVKEALQQAIAYTTLEEMSVDVASKALENAIIAARESNALYVQLDAIINKGEKAFVSNKPKGREILETAINNAKALKASGNIDADKVAAAEKEIDNAIFAYRVANGTGSAPKVTTGEVIVGSRAMVGRMDATGTNISERGFCWAENPNPTVLDEHSSYNQSNDETNWSPVYIMYNVKPSTEYWVRAYAMTNTYAVGYGEPVRVITLPKGETEYTYLWNAGDEHDEWLDNAMREATEYYNTWTAIKGFHPTANYSPGTETADCSYGGWINVGPWRCNTGTMVHEMMHGTGVGQHGRWWSQELHPGGDNGPWWLGERANRVCHFFENYDTSRGNYNCNGDNIHVCYEGNGNDMQQIRSAILAQALYEDGLPAVYDGACPFYSFESIDTLHYYITNNANGAGTKFLCEVSGKLSYRSVSNIRRLEEDKSYAWNIIYDKMTGLYFIKNAKSGKYFQHTGSEVNLTASKPSIKETIQLMPARIFADVKIGEHTINMKPYWFARSDRSEYPPVMAISGTSTKVSTPELNFSNNATNQFWLIFSVEDIATIVAAQDAFQQDRLQRLIDGSKAVAATPHKEVAEGQDVAFLGVVENVEQTKDTFSPEETEDAVQQLYNNLMAYLPAIEVLDSIDITFVIDDADLNTGSNWEGLPQLTNGMIRTTNTPLFTATTTIPVKMPAGQYGLVCNGYQRPGSISTCVKDYMGGTNKVRTVMSFNAKTLRLKHIAQGGAETKLNQGGNESLYSGIYVPSNNAAIEAYLNAGRYDNLLKMDFTSARTITIGIKMVQLVENDMLVVDGFKLYYYGNPTMTDIKNIEQTDISIDDNIIYDLSGRVVSTDIQDFENLKPGVYIINRKKVFVK